jgi:ABC-2 type transport system ATP-binding protein
MIKITHLTRRYGKLTAVDDISVHIKRGEVVGLLGHNGAGKTTVMKMLTGFLEPSAGSICVDQLEIGPDTTAIQRRIGYLPENCPIWPEMTVIELLEYQAALHDLPASRRARAVADAIGRTALKDKATALIQTLSRGYRQRVGVAQALLHQPDIVILDEPTNGLDPTQILHMRELIRELSQSATLIISTHILQEVQAVCDRVLIMRAGRLVVDARLDELQRESQLRVTLDRGENEVRAVLQAIQGVGSVKLTSELDGRFHYAVSAEESLAPAISAAVHEAGLALYSLYRERRTLETLFAEVNATDAHGKVPYAA